MTLERRLETGTRGRRGFQLPRARQVPPCGCPDMPVSRSAPLLALLTLCGEACLCPVCSLMNMQSLQVGSVRVGTTSLGQGSKGGAASP